MALAFEQAAEKLEPAMRLLKADTEAQQALAAAHRIQSIPTLMVQADGCEFKRISGAMDARRIVAWAQE
jgi:thioredoxin 2